MRDYRREALIDAPTGDVWELISRPETYPAWWPRVIEVRGERYEEGSEFVQVTKTPLGTAETVYALDAVEDLKRVRMHCTLSGIYADWRLTPAADATFVEVLFGADPERLRVKLYVETIARTYLRSWLEETVLGLQEGVRARAGSSAG